MITLEKESKELTKYKSLINEVNAKNDSKQRITVHVDVVLFFSYDIVGSTKYKAMHPGSWAGEIKKPLKVLSDESIANLVKLIFGEY